MTEHASRHPDALELLSIVRRYTAASYEATDLATGPWPNDPDGGEMRIVTALEAILSQCAQPENVCLLTADIEKLVADRFDGATESSWRAHAPTVERIVPPWDAATVDALNAYQTAGVGHPFTCPVCPDSPALFAMSDGWLCDRPTCDYTQTWAHAFMITEEARILPAELPPPDSNAVDNAIAETLQQHYGWVPLSVRYGAATAARAIVEQWREK